MQTLARGFKVKQMYVESGVMLCECPDGWYFGHGPRAKRITKDDAISISNPAIAAAIHAWLDSEAAREQEAAARRVAVPSTAPQAEPDTFSVLAQSLTVEEKAGLTQVIADYLSKRGVAAPAATIAKDGLVEKVVPGGTLKELPGGGKLFVPEDLEPDKLDEAAKEDESAGPDAAPAWVCQHCNTGYDTKAKRDGHLRWCKARKSKYEEETVEA